MDSPSPAYLDSSGLARQNVEVSYPGGGGCEVARGQPTEGILRTELVSMALAMKAPMGAQRGREALSVKVEPHSRVICGEAVGEGPCLGQNRTKRGWRVEGVPPT